MSGKRKMENPKDRKCGITKQDAFHTRTGQKQRQKHSPASPKQWQTNGDKEVKMDSYDNTMRVMHCQQEEWLRERIAALSKERDELKQENQILRCKLERLQGGYHA